MMTTTLGLWVESIGDLFVMRSCLGCHTPLTRQEPFICLDCQEGLEPTQAHLSPADNEVYRRIAGKVPIRHAVGMAYFDKGGTLQHILQSLKYSGNAELGVWLGKLYGRKLRSSIVVEEQPTLVPVPLHPRKFRKRGYNQAERISEGLAAMLHLPVEPHWLHRVKFTKTQTRMSGHRRYKNVENAFRWEGPPEADILLVDDVMTTGATLESCIRSMQAAGHRGNISIASIGVARI